MQEPISIDESDLEPENSIGENELEDIPIRIFEPEEEPIEIVFEEALPLEEIKIIKAPEPKRVDFIANQIEKLNVEVENEQERSAIEKAVNDIGAQISNIEERKDASDRILNLRNIEARLQALLRLLRSMKLPATLRDKLLEEIRSLEVRIRGVYHSLVTVYNKDADVEELEVTILPPPAGEEGILTITEEELPLARVAKERLPDGTYILGIQNVEKLKNSYSVEFSPGVLETILEFSERHGLNGERGGMLLGRFDIENRTVIVDCFFGIDPRSPLVDASGVHFRFSPEIWHELWLAIDRYNQETGIPHEAVGWFHTHPGLHAFLSADDRPIHDGWFPDFQRVGHGPNLAMVYDPIYKELATWCGVPISDEEERQMLLQMGEEYPLPGGRTLRHVPRYIVKGEIDPIRIQNLIAGQGHE